jgi:very-short-patch-repair endonuclease
MAAVLACGPGAALSHRSAAAFWGFGLETGRGADVSVPEFSSHHPPGVSVHRRRCLGPKDLDVLRGIPVTGPIRTLVDIAAQIDRRALERAVNEADRLDLTDPEALREGLGSFRGQRGVARLRDLLDRRTFRMTDSELERRFLPLVDACGLPRPLTRTFVNGFRVDFLWPDLGLVVETDGLRYHRTPAEQARDRVRDQAHSAGGLTPLRFTHAQVRHEPEHVRATLRAVAFRLGGGIADSI